MNFIRFDYNVEIAIQAGPDLCFADPQNNSVEVKHKSLEISSASLEEAEMVVESVTQLIDTVRVSKIPESDTPENNLSKCKCIAAPIARRIRETLALVAGMSGMDNVTYSAHEYSQKILNVSINVSRSPVYR